MAIKVRTDDRRFFFFNAWVLKYPIYWPWFVDFHHKRYVTTTSITTRNNEHSEIDRPIISPPGCDFLESKGKNCFVRVWFFFFKKGIYFYIRTLLDILEAQKLKEQLNHDNISWSWSNFGLSSKGGSSSSRAFFSLNEILVFLFLFWLERMEWYISQPPAISFKKVVVRTVSQI